MIKVKFIQIGVFRHKLKLKISLIMLDILSIKLYLKFVKLFTEEHFKSKIIYYLKIFNLIILLQ